MTTAGPISAPHAPGGAWTAPQFVNIGGESFPQMVVSANGLVTVVSQRSNGELDYVERLPSGNWTAPKVIAVLSGGAGADSGIRPQNAGAPIFVGNPAGAQVVFYQTSSLKYMAVRRQGSGAWGAPETVLTWPTGRHETRIAGGTIGAKGDMLFAWEESNYSCTPTPCGYNNFTVHATRELAATPGWVDSAIPPANRPDPWIVGPVIDPSGRGGLLMQAGAAATAIQATRQQASTGTWSKLVPAYTDTSGGTLALWGASIGQKDQATYAAIGLDSANSVLVGDGNLVSQSWSAPADLSVGDASPPYPALAYAGTTQGGAALIWSDLDDTVRATLRTSGGSAFVPTADAGRRG